MSPVCPHVSFANPQAPLDAEVRASVETRIDRDHKIHHAVVKVCFVFGLWRFDMKFPGEFHAGLRVTSALAPGGLLSHVELVAFRKLACQVPEAVCRQ